MSANPQQLQKYEFQMADPSIVVQRAFVFKLWLEF